MRQKTVEKVDNGSVIHRRYARGEIRNGIEDTDLQVAGCGPLRIHPPNKRNVGRGQVSVPTNGENIACEPFGNRYSIMGVGSNHVDVMSTFV